MLRHLNPLEYVAIGFIKFNIESPVNIGAGEIGVRRLFLKDEDVLIIPSSTWKGAFRSLTEKIAKSIEDDGFLDELSLLAVKSYREGKSGIFYRIDNGIIDEMVKVIKGEKSKLFNQYNREIINQIAIKFKFTKFEELIEGSNREFLEKITELILALNCPISKLYGNNIISGKIRFLDTLLRAGRYALNIRPGIAIDRASGKVKEDALFFIESATSNEGIYLNIIADNLMPNLKESKLFSLTLKAIIELGLEIGARKSVGLGKLSLNTKESYWYVVRLHDRLKLGNPFKYGEKLSIRDFIDWLWT
ncbi:MAG: RAMP superfamily CRISPR-associated protein [Candidatus Methanomethyliaceae archaeon]|nr:RAMP superfamily CRISPR-associated protein [Candidatus Methanomethyliaceae archaeon]MDW7971448.1 RAMP superfamily CRISPR-associated protein [Nitrososphaerota archaeon]